ncbi:MAG: hypothetical protein E7022_03285 [Desulfovibrio desulfuricans]|nr:hypothetical protein [Desulfovibrio desulfuricans]
MPPKSNQLVLPFDRLTENGLKPILKKFAKFECPVASVDAPNKAKRESGMLVKSFTLIFEDGQKMLVKVKAGGTIYQVKLNNKVVPVRNVDNMDKAVGEMIDYVHDNAKAYARAKIQRERRKIRPTKPSVTTTRQEKLAQATEDLQQLTQTNADLEKQLADTNTSTATSRAELAAAEKALDAERKKTASLEAQIAELEKAQGA